MSKQAAPHSNERAPQVDNQHFIQANSEAKSRYGRFNLGIVGGTGVGKSSLVNAVFGRDYAKVGKGLPVTSGVNYYHDDSLGIWDFEGFEIGSAQSPAQALQSHLATIAQRPANEQISVVWYCITANADRLTLPDVEMIRQLDASGLPVILVLTKVDWHRNPVTGKYKAPEGVEEFKRWIEDPTDANGVRLHLPIQRVILTSAHSGNGKPGKDAGHGLGELVAETLALAPADEQNAFRIAQRLNLPWKRDLARPVIAAASSAAAAAAAIPIPVADATALAPIQMGMMGRIAAIYELDFKSMLSTSALAQMGAQITGHALARSFVKLIPGVGSVVNAGVAFSLTAATGETWMRLCEQIYTGKVKPNQVAGAWQDYLPGVLAVGAKMLEHRVGRK